VIRVGMVAKLAAVKQERNATILKVIEKEGGVRRLSEQLQSKRQTLVSASSSSSRAHHNFLFSFIFQRSRPSWSSLEHLGSRTQLPLARPATPGASRRPLARRSSGTSPSSGGR
jgi:hypothetical protein